MQPIELLLYVDDRCKADPKDLYERYLKLSEESGELAKKLLPYLNAAGTVHRFTTREAVLEEVADTLLSAYSIAHKLGADLPELLQMIEKKASKWQQIQVAEGYLKDIKNVPYELHVSVAHEDDDQTWYEDPKNQASFDMICRDIGVKPARLILYLPDGTTRHDWMTSSTCAGTTQDAGLFLTGVSASLQEMLDLIRSPLKITRHKIETVPWHPAAPSVKGTISEMPDGCYFEKHWELLLPDTPEAFEDLRSRVGKTAVLSRNARKPPVDGFIIMSATLRLYKGTQENFRTQCDFFALRFHKSLTDIKVIDSIAEFSIYDPKGIMDVDWIGEKTI